MRKKTSYDNFTRRARHTALPSDRENRPLKRRPRTVSADPGGKRPRVDETTTRARVSGVAEGGGA